MSHIAPPPPDRVTEPGRDPFPLPPDEEAGLRLWWHVLRPDRLRIADELDRTARAYRHNPDAAEALRHAARWLRAAAGEPNAESDGDAAEKWRLIVADTTAAVDD